MESRYSDGVQLLIIRAPVLRRPKIIHMRKIKFINQCNDGAYYAEFKTKAREYNYISCIIESNYFGGFSVVIIDELWESWMDMDFSSLVAAEKWAKKQIIKTINDYL